MTDLGTGFRDPVEIAAKFGKHKIFGVPDGVAEHLTHLDKVARNLVDGYPRMEWPETITPTQMIPRLMTLIGERMELEFKNRSVKLVYAQVDYHHKRKYENGQQFFLVEGSPRWDDKCRFVYLTFLPLLEKQDLLLHDIIVATVSHVYHKVGIPLWDNMDHVLDWMEEMVEQEGELDPDVKPQWRKEIKEWREGKVFLKWKEIVSARKKFSQKRLRRMVNTYNWNSHFKSRILLWVRNAEKLYNGAKGPFASYCKSLDSGGDYSLADQLYGFLWDSPHVFEQWEQWFNELWSNTETVGMCRVVNVEAKGFRGLPPDPTMRLIDDWMVLGCFIFDSDFMKNVNRPKRYITKASRLIDRDDILDPDDLEAELDTDAEYFDLGNGVIADRVFAEDLILQEARQRAHIH